MSKKKEKYQSIEEVLEALDRIIDRSVEENDFSGVFAYVYRRTTDEIRQCIVKKQFNDNKRMESFDVVFAQLYIDAYNSYQRGDRPSMSWEICFESRNTPVSFTQHILMGMNAHINLDLGIAAAAVGEKADRDELKEDFDKVNQILNELIDEMQARISRASRLLYFLDWLGGKRDEKWIDSSIRKYRTEAWTNACRIMDLRSEEAKSVLIDDLDCKTAEQSKMILRPPNFFIRGAIHLIRLFETKDIKKIIEGLRSDERPLIRI